MTSKGAIPPRFSRRLVIGFLTGLTLLFILLHQAVEILWPDRLPGWTGPVFLDVVILAIGLLSILGADRWIRETDQRAEVEKRLRESEKAAGEADKRLAVVLRAGQMFAEAGEEEEVINHLLQIAVDLVGAKGASFVPLDEHGQSLPALTVGEIPSREMGAWVEYLASPVVRQQCASCQSREQFTLSCPLLNGPMAWMTGVFCLPLRRGEYEFGVLNLFISQGNQLDAETQALLRAILDETNLALESVRLRKRELATLGQLKAVREKADLKSLLAGLLKTLREALGADFATAVLWDGEAGHPKESVSSGDFPDGYRAQVDETLQGVMASREPSLFEEGSGKRVAGHGFQALMSAPLVVEDLSVLGALLVANQGRPFSQRQFSMLQMVAGQVAMVVQNFDRLAELEYKAVIEERTRLAREIHDGLAQTLGFLKLKTAQMINYLDQGELDQLGKTMQTTYEGLSEAYLDTRQAIDGLRISSLEDGLAGWLRQTAKEFQDYSDLNVQVCEPLTNVDLQPEIHVQLIRIVQEALSNIRKHSHAHQVWISCQRDNSSLILEIKDDGVGFCPEEVPGPSRHGLKGMRERAELIGADLQITGEPQSGTSVRVLLALETATQAVLPRENG